MYDVHKLRMMFYFHFCCKFLQLFCCIKWNLYMYIINGWFFFFDSICAFGSYHLLQRFDLCHVNIMSKTFIAEVSYPARCASKITQAIDIITSTTRVDAFLRTVLPKIFRLATWWKRIKSCMFLEIMQYLLHWIS